MNALFLALLAVVSTTTSNAENCTSNLVLNGDFETGIIAPWSQFGQLPSISEGGAHGSLYALKQTGRTYHWHGPAQDLAVACFEPGDRFLLRAEVRMEKDGQAHLCNRAVIGGDSGCPVASIHTVQDTGIRTRDVATVVGDAGVNGWYGMRGVFTMYSFDKASSKVQVRFKDAPVGVDIFIDGVSVVKVDQNLTATS